MQSDVVGRRRISRFSSTAMMAGGRGAHERLACDSSSTEGRRLGVSSRRRLWDGRLRRSRSAKRGRPLAWSPHGHDPRGDPRRWPPPGPPYRPCNAGDVMIPRTIERRGPIQRLIADKAHDAKVAIVGRSGNNNPSDKDHRSLGF